jgi:hypothetical protein
MGHRSGSCFTWPTLFEHSLDGRCRGNRKPYRNAINRMVFSLDSPEEISAWKSVARCSCLQPRAHYPPLAFWYGLSGALAE